MDRLKPKGSAPEPPRSDEPLDFPGLARAVATSSPSLKFVAIDLSPVAKGPNPEERAWFRVVYVKDSRLPHVVRITGQEGRALAEKMRAFNRYD